MLLGQMMIIAISEVTVRASVGHFYFFSTDVA